MRRVFAGSIAAAAIGGMSGCATGVSRAGAQRESAQSLRIQGALNFRARVALPPDGVAIVELKETTTADGRVVAERRIGLQSRQVPIPFALAVDRARIVSGRSCRLRGGVLVNGRPLPARPTRCRSILRPQALMPACC